MKEKLREFVGKRLDINCGSGSIFRGSVKDVGEDFVTIIDEDEQNTSIALSKIIAITECVEPAARPGFIV